MIKARFEKEFNTKVLSGNAHTLCPSYVGENDSGWVVDGAIHEDYYEWVNDFQARHSEKGLVWGNFEDVVHATSQEAYDDFVKHHPPSEWDYGDI